VTTIRKQVTEETQLSLTNRATHLCIMQWCGSPKARPSPCAEFGRSTSNRVRISRGEPPKLGFAGITLSSDGGVADLKQSTPPLMLHCRTWSFCVKGCRHKQRKAHKLGNAGALPFEIGREAWLTPRNTTFQTCVIMPNLAVLDQTIRALLRRYA